MNFSESRIWPWLLWIYTSVTEIRIWPDGLVLTRLGGKFSPQCVTWNPCPRLAGCPTLGK